MHVVIKDNFLEKPLKIRELALELEYKRDSRGTYSGKRTADIKDTHKFLYDGICKKIAKIYQINLEDYSISMYFHVTEGEFGDTGWVHVDGCPSSLACIVYLNPDVNGSENGTGIYDLNRSIQTPHNENEIAALRKSFTEGKDYIDEKTSHNLKFIKTITVGGKFNRLIAYPANTFHAGEGYFGTDVKDSRLTLLAFLNRK